MSNQSANAYIDEIKRVTNHFSMEFNLTYAEAIGCLEIFKNMLYVELEGLEYDKENETT